MDKELKIGGLYKYHKSNLNFTLKKLTPKKTRFLLEHKCPEGGTIKTSGPVKTFWNDWSESEESKNN